MTRFPTLSVRILEISKFSGGGGSKVRRSCLKYPRQDFLVSGRTISSSGPFFVFLICLRSSHMLSYNLARDISDVSDWTLWATSPQNRTSVSAPAQSECPSSSVMVTWGGDGVMVFRNCRGGGGVPLIMGFPELSSGVKCTLQGQQLSNCGVRNFLVLGLLDVSLQLG